MSKTVGLLGNGGQADEVESYLGEDFDVAFRAVSEEYLTSSNPKLINIDDPKDHGTVAVIAAVGAPAARRKMVKMWPGADYLTVVSKDALVDKNVSLGKGSVVAPGAVITTNVVIGEHTLINIGTTVSHDCKIGDFVTVSPGVHIAGNVEIGDGVFIGIGANISNNVKIAAGSVIGAGTVVLKDVEAENSVIVGVPGKLVSNNEDWLSEI